MNVYACVHTYISYRYEYMVKCTYINLHVIQMHIGNGYIHMCLPVCIYIHIYVHTHMYIKHSICLRIHFVILPLFKGKCAF